LHDLVAALGHFQMHVRSIEGRGNHVMAAIELSIEGTGSGAAMTGAFFHVVRCSGSQIREVRTYQDAAQARREYERLTATPSG
jgi:hypothetical protein